MIGQKFGDYKTGTRDRYDVSSAFTTTTTTTTTIAVVFDHFSEEDSCLGSLASLLTYLFCMNDTRTHTKT